MTNSRYVSQSRVIVQVYILDCIFSVFLSFRGLSQSRIRDRYRCDGAVYCDNRLIGKNGISLISRKVEI